MAYWKEMHSYEDYVNNLLLITILTETQILIEMKQKFMFPSASALKNRILK